MTMLPRNRTLIIVVIALVCLLVIQQLVYHLSRVLTTEPFPEELRHLFTQDARLISNHRLHFKRGTGWQQLELSDDAARLRQHEDAAPLTEKRETILLLQRLASLLSRERTREALAEILGSVQLDPTRKPFKQQVAALPTRQAAPTPQAKPRTAPGKIPKILHQTFSSARVYKNYQALIESCLRLNPDWMYYLWTDEDADALMARHFPDMLKTVKMFKHNLEKSDTLRLMILYKFGGIYVDMDIECKEPFYPLLSNRTAFLDQEQPIHANLLYGRDFIVSNSAMGAAPGHPLFKQALERVASEKKFGVPMLSTGPSMLTSVLEEYRKSADFKAHPMDLLPHYVMSPETDGSQSWEVICNINQLRNAKEKFRQHKARELTIQEEACLLLESQNWKLNDTRPETVAVHKFLHLGYPENVLKRRLKIACFNATQHFANRIHFYSKELPLR